MRSLKIKKRNWYIVKFFIYLVIFHYNKLGLTYRYTKERKALLEYLLYTWHWDTSDIFTCNSNFVFKFLKLKLREFKSLFEDYKVSNCQINHNLICILHDLLKIYPKGYENEIKKECYKNQLHMEEGINGGNEVKKML